MPILARVTIADEAKAIVIHDEGVAAAARNDGNGIETLAIADGDEFCSAIKRDAGVTEILRDEIAGPAVFDVVELNENPTVIFVGVVAEEIGFGVNVFDAGIGDAARPVEFPNRAIGILAVDGAGDGRIDEDTIAFDTGDGALHIDVIAVGRPWIGEEIHAKIMNPIAGGDAPDKDMIPEGQAADAIDIKTARSDRDVIVRYVVSRPADG